MSILTEVENLFEELRGKLVKLVGDHHSVHSAVDDAKAAVAVAVPAEEVPLSTELTEQQKADAQTFKDSLAEANK